MDLAHLTAALAALTEQLSSEGSDLVITTDRGTAGGVTRTTLRVTRGVCVVLDASSDEAVDRAEAICNALGWGLGPHRSLARL
jgi:hypothetical protein